VRTGEIIRGPQIASLPPESVNQIPEQILAIMRKGKRLPRESKLNHLTSTKSRSRASRSMSMTSRREGRFQNKLEPLLACLQEDSIFWMGGGAI
jgi:hypothetical protein